MHFAAAVALFGELLFVVWTARPDPGATLRRRSLRVAAWCLALLLASGFAWLAAQAAEMSGLPLARALNRETLGVVLSETTFGRVWVARFVLATALGAALFFAGRGGAALDRTCALLAALLLATLAFAGHAAAEQGTDRVVHLGSDALHLVAAGAWLGALWPLARLLAHARRAADGPELEFAGRVTRRFSAAGIASVGALIATGVANAWYTLGSVPALFGTDYGRLLLAKLALFAAMIALAAINRMRWTPRLRAARGDSGGSAPLALRRLKRNAIAETFLGLAVLGVVGALGVTVPAPHVQTVWPFPYTISGWRLAPAHPSTYFRSPVRYTAASIARGAPLYSEYCETCHGAYGYGDGPAAASLAVRTPNLTEHISHHRVGDMLWWVQHGIAGTPMPGFAERISDERLWDLLNFLRAQADAERAKEMDSGVGEWRPIAAPDFDFQVDEHPQESLRAHLGRYVLLVFYAHPDAGGRLRALEAAQSQLRRAGVRVVAMAMKGAEMPRHAGDVSMIAEPDSRVAAAYALFRRTANGVPPVPDHIEFLIDRDGNLRARWTPGEKPDWSRIPELLAQIEMLDREGAHKSAPAEHVH